jgi:hypothetical protein
VLMELFREGGMCVLLTDPMLLNVLFEDDDDVSVAFASARFS